MLTHSLRKCSTQSAVSSASGELLLIPISTNSGVLYRHRENIFWNSGDASDKTFEDTRSLVAVEGNVMRTSPLGSIAFAFEFRASFSGGALGGAVGVGAGVRIKVEVEAKVELKIEVVVEVEAELEVETARMPKTSP